MWNSNRITFLEEAQVAFLACCCNIARGRETWKLVSLHWDDYRLGDRAHLVFEAIGVNPMESDWRKVHLGILGNGDGLAPLWLQECQTAQRRADRRQAAFRREKMREQRQRPAETFPPTRLEQLRAQQRERRIDEAVWRAAPRDLGSEGVDNYKKWSVLFANTDKLHLYRHSDFFYDCLEFCVLFYVHHGLKMGKKPPRTARGATRSRRRAAKKRVLQMMHLARGFNYVMSRMFQLPEAYRGTYVCALFDHDAPAVCVETHQQMRSHFTSRDALDRPTCHKGYVTTLKDYFLMHGSCSQFTDQEMWLRKNLIVPTIVHDICLRTEQPFQEEAFLKKYDPVQFDQVKYVNVLGYSISIMEEQALEETAARSRMVEKEREGEDEEDGQPPEMVAIPLPVTEWRSTRCRKRYSSLLIHDMGAWMRYLPGVVDFIQRYVCSDPGKRVVVGGLARRPRLVDMSNNEWVLLYQKRIVFGMSNQVVQSFVDIIKRDFGGTVLTRAGTVERSIASFLHTTDGREREINVMDLDMDGMDFYGGSDNDSDDGGEGGGDVPTAEVNDWDVGLAWFRSGGVT